MTVDDYHFGRIAVNGRVYTKDVLILPTGVQSPWWRREGHRLEPADLEAVLTDPPETLVIGTGYYGNMAVPEETVQALEGAGVAVWVGRTTEAVAELDRLQRHAARVAAALHLTC